MKYLLVFLVGLGAGILLVSSTMKNKEKCPDTKPFQEAIICLQQDLSNVIAQRDTLKRVTESYK